jgi:lipoprotein-releasing system permease protein
MKPNESASAQGVNFYSGSELRTWCGAGGRLPCAPALKTPFSLFLALRYLRPKRTFVSAITVISILGVTLGICVLILVIAVMTGFDQELRRKVLGFDAHVLITSETTIDDWRRLMDEVKQVPGVVAAAPFVQGPVIVECDGRRLAPKIRGIDLEQELKVTDIKSAIVQWNEPPWRREEVKGAGGQQTIFPGELQLSSEECVIGSELAAQLGAFVGGKVIVYSPGNMGEIMDALNKAEKDPNDKTTLSDLRSMVLPQELTVAGIFSSGRYQYDAEYLIVPLHIGQELYGLGDGLHGITIKTDDPYHAARLKETLEGVVPPQLSIYTWIDLNKQLFDAIRLERNTMFFLLLFIVIVAAFGIMSTLITVTVQKTREIGVMKALGATPAQIVWVFLAQGMVVGFFGNITGLAAGMALIRWRNEFKDFLARALGIEIFPPGIYQFSAIPAEVVPGDVAIICVSAFVICSLAALIPAYFAARLDPVKALRFE